MKNVFSYNLVSRIVFLLITPILFQAFNFAFIWHSIYWGAITLVVVIWGVFLLITPLFGRIGCGWFCFMGTIQDFSSQHSLFHIKWKKPILWTRLFMITAFFSTAFIFFFLRKEAGNITEVKFDLWFLKMEFSSHYKHIWLYDTMGAILLGLLLERRWACRNLCFMGALCAPGASISRLLPVVDADNCNLCGKCETDCLVRIPIKEYVLNNHGLVTNAECVLCGKCSDSCSRNAIKFKFIWNRKEYLKRRRAEATPRPRPGQAVLQS